jgi:hypothetical protein
MNYEAFMVAILLVTILAFCLVEYGKPLLTMLGLQDDERNQ